MLLFLEGIVAGGFIPDSISFAYTIQVFRTKARIKQLRARLKLLAFFKGSQVNGVKPKIIDKLLHLPFRLNVITS